MVNRKEIRIGNYLKKDNGFITVDSMDEYGINFEVNYGGKYEGIEYEGLFDSPFERDCLFPIEITEELLAKSKFNFHKGNSDSSWVNCNLDSFVYLNNTDGKFYYVISVEVDDYSCYYFIEKEVKYIHQLQNIHFIWNEEELDISI